MAESAFREAIAFFDRLGIYDVVLPFILAFTIVFAILEKTKIFGTEKIGKEEYTRKNLNAMVAFVTGALVVASGKLVAVINETIAQLAVVVILAIFFIIMIATLHSGKDEEVKLPDKWKKAGMAVILVALVLITANALGWLKPAWNYVMDNTNESIVGSIVLVILIIWFISYMGSSENESDKKKEDEKK